MLTEQIDMLRCIAPHTDSWLVASSTRSEARHIVDGRLGCPVCRAEYPILDAVAQFGPTRNPAPLALLDDEQAFRIAAQLHLIEAPAPVLLTGAWSSAVVALLRITPTVKLFVGNTRVPIPRDDRVSVLTLPAARFPLAAGTLRGVALDAEHAASPLLADVARIIRAGGRLVAPATVALDASCWKPLVRDAEVQVAERLPSASAPIQIKRAPSQPLFDS